MAKQGFGGQWIEVCRVGKAVDSTGTRRDLDRKYLEAVVANYNAGNHEAPIVIGHPESDTAPAFGWTEELRLNGDVVEARFKETDDEFEKLVGQGRYKKRSGSFYLDPPNLRHIGFLGAQPPSIKGLRDIQFASGESITIETQFNLQEKKMEEKDLDQLPDSFWTKFKSKLGIGEKTDLGEPATPADKGASTEFTEAKVMEIAKAAVEAATAEFKEQITQLKAENEKLTEKVDGQVAGGVRAEIASFVESIPAEKGKHFLKNIGIASFLESLAVADAADEKKAVSFSEGEGDDKTTHEFSRLEFAKNLLTSLPPMISFGERFGNIVATKEADAMINPERVESMKEAAGVKTEKGGAK